VARVAGAEAAIELAGTAEEHIAATKVQAIQRVRVARAQLAAKKAASAAKLADVDAKLAAEEGSENEAEEELTWRRLRRSAWRLPRRRRRPPPSCRRCVAGDPRASTSRSCTPRSRRWSPPTHGGNDGGCRGASRHRRRRAFLIGFEMNYPNQTVNLRHSEH